MTAAREADPGDTPRGGDQLRYRMRIGRGEDTRTASFVLKLTDAHHHFWASSRRLTRRSIEELLPRAGVDPDVLDDDVVARWLNTSFAGLHAFEHANLKLLLVADPDSPALPEDMPIGATADLLPYDLMRVGVASAASLGHAHAAAVAADPEHRLTPQQLDDLLLAATTISVLGRKAFLNPMLKRLIKDAIGFGDVWRAGLFYAMGFRPQVQVNCLAAMPVDDAWSIPFRLTVGPVDALEGRIVVGSTAGPLWMAAGIRAFQATLPGDDEPVLAMTLLASERGQGMPLAAGRTAYFRGQTAPLATSPDGRWVVSTDAGGRWLWAIEEHRTRLVQRLGTTGPADLKLITGFQLDASLGIASFSTNTSALDGLNYSFLTLDDHGDLAGVEARDPWADLVRRTPEMTGSSQADRKAPTIQTLLKR